MHARIVKSGTWGGGKQESDNGKVQQVPARRKRTEKRVKLGWRMIQGARNSGRRKER